MSKRRQTSPPPKPTLSSNVIRREGCLGVIIVAIIVIGALAKVIGGNL